MSWMAMVLAFAAPQPDDVVPDEVIIVYGEQRVQAARDKLINDLESLGYNELVERDGRLILRHQQNWKGKVVLYDDGFMEFKRQAPEGTMPDTFFKEASPLIGWVPCLVVPTACVKVGGLVVSKRKLSAVETRTTRAVAAQLQVLGERQADLATQNKLEGLDERLASLWEHGVPLEGDPHGLIAEGAERRAALLAYWATRTDTPWGARMRQPVEAFLRGVVQSSDTPVTPAELDAINAPREGLPQLAL